jgi:hypothetical protein
VGVRRFAAVVFVAVTIGACGGNPAPSSGPILTASASAVVDAPPSVTSAPSGTATVQWRRVSEIRDVTWSGSFGAVGFDDGYVTVDGSRTIAVSTDGVTWRRVTLPLPFAGTVVDGVGSVSTDGRRTVIVGGYSPCPEFSWEMDPAPGRCRLRPMSWVSDDGRTWRSSGRWTGPVGPAEFFGSTFSTTWNVPTGGWDTTQTFFASNESEGDGQALWHSEDGVKWSLLRAGPADPRFSWAVADGQGNRVAYEQQPEPPTECNGTGPHPTLVWTSSDGRKYQRLDAFPGKCGEWIRAALAPAGTGPWVFLGVAEKSGTNAQPMTWASQNLTAWTTSDLPEPPDLRDERVWALAHRASGYVATGEFGEGRHAMTWVSDDGITWRLADAGRATGLGDIVFTIAHGPAGMLGFGCGDPVCEGTATAVWRLEDVR